jgi:hypothetical protein
VKIIYIGLAMYEIYIKHKEPKNTKKREKIQYLKERVETLFKGLMAVLLLILFNPRRTKDTIKLDYETRLLLYLFGFILLLTADWKSIFHNIPKTIQMIQDILGRNH